MDYLKQRGLTGEIAKRFDLGFTPPGWDNLLQALGDSEEQRNDERHGVLLMVSWRGKSTCVLHGAVRRIKIAIEP